MLLEKSLYKINGTMENVKYEYHNDNLRAKDGTDGKHAMS